MRVRITEYLDIDLMTEHWCCNRCSHDLGPANTSYKKGCLLHERNPLEIHPALSKGKDFNFSFDPEWVRIIEFYCPGCGVLLENEYLPPGHPLTADIELDLEALKAKHLGEAATRAADRD